jgi:glycosyltransferase involved in cell wall biosynthesis
MSVTPSIGKKPFISVVIPTFNRVQQVQTALTSVLAQTYGEFEVIVVDDGSSDGTENALRSLIAARASNGIQVRYIFQPNQGQSVARNRGAGEARGEWVAFLDSDDVWFPEKLERQVEAIEKFKGRSWACITDARWIDHLGTDTTSFRRGGRNYAGVMGLDHDAVNGLAKFRDPFCVSTLLVHAGIGKKTGWFEPRLKYAEDHDFLLRLSLVTPFCYVNELHCLIDQSRYAQGSECRPWDQIELRLRNWQSVLEKWLALDGKLPPEAKRTIVHNLRSVHSAWANWHLEHKRYDDARESVHEAIQYEVTAGLLIKWALTQVAPSVAKRFAPQVRVNY